MTESERRTTFDLHVLRSSRTNLFLLTRAKELNKYIEPPAPNCVLTPILKSGEPPDSHIVKGFSGKVNFEDNSLPEVLLLRGGTILSPYF